MSKVKAPKSKGIPNKHLHARTSFLYQAATYLTLQTSSQKTSVTTTATDDAHVYQTSQCQYKSSPLALELGCDLQQVSRKGQLRLSVDLKRSMCKSCNTVLIPGQTATHAIENQSKNCKKPWADVLVVTCNFCNSKKKFPVGSNRQLKKSKRKTAEVGTLSSAHLDDAAPNPSALPGTGP